MILIEKSNEKYRKIIFIPPAGLEHLPEEIKQQDFEVIETEYNSGFAKPVWDSEQNKIVDSSKTDLNIESHKAGILQQLSKKSKQARDTYFDTDVDLVIQNYFLKKQTANKKLPDYEEERIQQIIEVGMQCRDEFHRVKKLIDKAKTIQQVDDAFAKTNFIKKV